MKLRSIGLTILATIACTAMATSAASATEYPGFETATKGPVSFTGSTSSRLTFELHSGAKFECEKGLSSPGTIAPGHEMSEVALTLHGCWTKTHGQEAGTVQTKPLIGRLVNLPKERIGIAFVPKSGTIFAETESILLEEWGGQLVAELGGTRAELEAGGTTFTLNIKKGTNAGEQGLREYSFLGTGFVEEQLKSFFGPELLALSTVSWTITTPTTVRIRPA
jgi:hypothetical protein